MYKYIFFYWSQQQKQYFHSLSTHDFYFFFSSPQHMKRKKFFTGPDTWNLFIFFKILFSQVPTNENIIFHHDLFFFTGPHVFLNIVFTGTDTWKKKKNVNVPDTQKNFFFFLNV